MRDGECADSDGVFMDLGRHNAYLACCKQRDVLEVEVKRQNGVIASAPESSSTMNYIYAFLTGAAIGIAASSMLKR